MSLGAFLGVQTIQHIDGRLIGDLPQIPPLVWLHDKRIRASRDALGTHDAFFMYIMKRTQIYLGDGQHARLARLATASGVTKSSLIRDAIDAFLQGSKPDGNSLLRFHAVLEEIERGPVSLADGRQYVKDLRRRDLARQQELERPRRA